MNGAASPDRRTDRLQAKQAASQRRKRLLLALGGGAIVIALIVVAVVALGGGDSDSNDDNASSTTTGPKTTVSIEVGEISTDSAGSTASFSPEQAQQVLAAIRTYLDEAAVKPMRSGQPAGDLSTVFDPGALAKATGIDRPIMTQEGLPKVTGDLTVTAPPVAFVGLGDYEGKVVLVTAALQVSIDGKIAGSKVPLHIEQKGDFVFAPDAAGAWKVTGYHMTVTRSGGGVDVTTTLTPPATTKAGK